MVPKVAAKGTSFKGAGLYYLHDKDAKTTERVAFMLLSSPANPDLLAPTATIDGGRFDGRGLNG